MFCCTNPVPYIFDETDSPPESVLYTIGESAGKWSFKEKNPLVLEVLF